MTILQNTDILEQRILWLQHAETLRPALKHWRVNPVAMVEPVDDPGAWQKLRMDTRSPAAALPGLSWNRGDRLILDFGETAVGHFTLDMRVQGGYCDSPVHLRMLAAEMPLELNYTKESFHGQLSSAWIQEEYFKFDALPQSFTLPRRYSARYLLLEVIATPGPLIFEQIHMTAEGIESELPEPVGELDRVGLRTLRNCMQRFFEDGPKRDRRLWLGDLRLQAMVNAVSFRRFDQVERSIYLLAAGTSDKGIIPACVFDTPGAKSNCNILDYSLLFAPMLLDHYRWSGNRQIVNDLYELAVLQFDFARCHFDKQNIFQDPGNWWLMVDHCNELNRQIPLQAIFVYGLRSLAELAEILLHYDEARQFRREAQSAADAVRHHFYDRERNLISSGPQRQISHATQIWCIIAGIVTPEEGRALLASLEKCPGAVRPVTPYLQHHLLEAYRICGENDKLLALIESYWGGMIRHGADTFWEAYDPDDEFFSPYADARLNSTCHAWSCTPSYYLRNRMK